MYIFGQYLLQQDFCGSDVNNSVPVTPVKKVRKGKAAGTTASTVAADQLQDYSVEYAKSGRAGCRGCDDKIAKVCII